MQIFDWNNQTKMKELLGAILVDLFGSLRQLYFLVHVWCVFPTVNLAALCVYAARASLHFVPNFPSQ